MTVQSSDSFLVENKEYVLIDVEKDKQIINCAEFHMPEHAICVSTDCKRGYTAKYMIKDNKLYGKRYEWDEEKNKEVASASMFMNFTGSCIIARATEDNGWLNSDFLICYLDFDEAYELHFTNGVLDEILDLEQAIIEAREFTESDVYKSKDTEPFTRNKCLEGIARGHLKYNYDYRTYKWRRT